METQSDASEVVELTYREITALTDLLATWIARRDLVGAIEEFVANEREEVSFEEYDDDTARLLQDRRARIQPRVNTGYLSLRRRGLIEETDDEGKYAITNKVLEGYVRVAGHPHTTAPFAFVRKTPSEKERRIYKMAPFGIAPDLPILEETSVFPPGPELHGTFVRCIPDSTALMPHLLSLLGPLRNLPETITTYPDWYHPASSVVNQSWIEAFYQEFPYGDVYELLRDVDVPNDIARRLGDDCADENTYYGISTPACFPFPVYRSDWYGFVFAIPASPQSESNYVNYVWLFQSGWLAPDTPEEEAVSLKIEMVSGMKAMEAMASHAVEAVRHAEAPAPNFNSDR